MCCKRVKATVKLQKPGAGGSEQQGDGSGTVECCERGKVISMYQKQYYNMQIDLKKAFSFN
jgi:hypothetical protein